MFNSIHPTLQFSVDPSKGQSNSILKSSQCGGQSSTQFISIQSTVQFIVDLAKGFLR